MNAGSIMDRAHLVDPGVFYPHELHKLRRGTGIWAGALCPFHDDHHPSFSVNLRTGGFICHACRVKGGSLIDYVMIRDSCAAWAAADTLLHQVSSPILKRSIARGSHDATRYARARAALRTLWRESAPLNLRTHTIARRYFEARELDALIDDPPADIRFHPSLQYWQSDVGKPTVLGRYPALLATVRGAGGQRVSIHRTYLAPDGLGKADVPAPRKMCTPIAPHALVGAAIRLYPASDGALAVGEGWETALAGRVLNPARAAWATISAAGMASLKLPLGVRAVWILVDADQAGRDAAAALAQRLLAERRRVWAATPPVEHSDWADMLSLPSSAMEATP